MITASGPPRAAPATRGPGAVPAPPRQPNTGSRAFWLMTALAGAARALIIAGSCCLVTVIARQVTGHGISALWETYPSLLPAAALLAVTGAGLARGTWSAARALGQTAAFHRGARARRVPVPARLARAAARAGIPARRLAAVTASAPFALTYGLFRPRILASTALAADLDGAELAAVLAHEREHVRRRDPLKDLIARILPARFFYLPWLAHLQARYAAGRELAADRAALARHPRAALAGALLKVSAPPGWAAAPAAAMSTAALLDARITQLETGTEPPLPRARPAAVAASAAATALTAAAGWSALVIAHYMPLCAAMLT